MADFTGFKKSPKDVQEVDENGADINGKRFLQLKLLMKKAKPELKAKLLEEPDGELSEEDKKMFRDLQVER